MTPQTQNDLLGMIWQGGDWSVALQQTQELKDLLDKAGMKACFHQNQAMPESVERLQFNHHDGLWALPASDHLSRGWVLVWKIDPSFFSTETEQQPTTV